MPKFGIWIAIRCLSGFNDKKAIFIEADELSPSNIRLAVVLINNTTEFIRTMDDQKNCKYQSGSVNDCDNPLIIGFNR